MWFVGLCLRFFGRQKNSYLPLCMACIESGVLTCNGKDQRCWNSMNNPSWPTWWDVYVHWTQGKH